MAKVKLIEAIHAANTFTDYNFEDVANCSWTDLEYLREVLLDNIPFKHHEEFNIYFDKLHPPLDMIGKPYHHKNGNIYTPIILTNIGNSDSQPRLDHPIDVVYMGHNGKIWSRPLSDWKRSFTPVFNI